MKKSLLLVFAIASTSAFAGRGAILVVDNSTDTTLKVVPTNKSCVAHIESAAISLKPVTASNIYLEQDCLLKSGSSNLELYDEKTNEKIAVTEFSIAKSSTNAGVKSSTSIRFSVRSLSVNTFSRVSGTDIIFVRITPAGQNAVNYSNWMWQMRSQIRDKNLSSLVLPGTHDSLTYDLSSSNLCAADPDATAFAKAPRFGIAFAKAQYLTMQEQLERGIRYFDIRLCFQSGDSYPSHSLVSNHLFSYDLEQLQRFLNTNSHEVIILDLQHIYGYNVERIKALLDDIKTKFAGKIISYQDYKPTSKLDDIWTLDDLSSESTPNLIIIAPDSKEVQEVIAESAYNFIWPRATLSSPWPNVQNVDQLTQKNSDYLNNRNAEAFFVNQLVLTPDTNYIISNPSYSLSSIAYRNLNSTYNWLWENANSGKLNIIIRDWSNGYDGAIFAIDANSKKK